MFLAPKDLALLFRLHRNLNEDFKEAKPRHGIVNSLPMSDRPIAAPCAKANPVRHRSGGKTADPGGIEGHFPTVAAFVQDGGRIEIGDHEGFGFVAKALDYGGLVLESRKVSTVANAMTALEKGLANRARQQSRTAG
ncbi:MAG TPA: hypothetical protein VGI81_23605 [Tepidisphaeraceae bacterium]|jgi:hypothetical protein